jgi:restriction system protein
MSIFNSIANFFSKPEKTEQQKEFDRIEKDEWLENYKNEKNKAEWSLNFLMSLEWKRYEEICKEFLTMKENGKYKVDVTKTGADGGIDLRITDKKEKLVGVGQCKAYNSKITIEKIRELYGIMASEKAEQGYFFTTSSFTNDCIEFAKEKKIELIDGEQQIKTIQSFTPAQQNHLYKIATNGDYTTPTCPKCDKKMIERTAKEKGNKFWGCANYPRCKNILQMRK